MDGTSIFSQDLLNMLGLQNAAFAVARRGLQISDSVFAKIFSARGQVKRTRSQERIDEMFPMTERQIEQFWDHVYAFSFLNHGVPVPEEPLPMLDELQRDGDDETLTAGEDYQAQASFFEDEPLYPQEELGFTLQQKLVLEYFAVQVHRYGGAVPIPERVRRRLRSRNRLSPERDDNGNGGEGLLEVAVCSCPYCWMYTEDLARFMEHLWERHAVVGKGDERKDSGYEKTIAIGVDIESKEPEELTAAPTAVGTAAIQPRASEDVRTSPCEAPGAQLDAGMAKPDEWKSLVGRVSGLMAIASGVHTTSPTVNHDSSVGTFDSREALDLPFWRKLLTPPLLSGPGSPSTQNRPLDAQQGRRAATMQEKLKEMERHAQRVRDKMEPIPWFDPYVLGHKQKQRQTTDKRGEAETLRIREVEERAEGESEQSRRLATSGHAFKLSIMHASGMAKVKTAGSEAEDKVEKDGNIEAGADARHDYSSEKRYWICPHDEKCNIKFDSVVLFIEHLSSRGLVVYKKWTELHGMGFPGARDMRYQWEASGM